MGHYAAVPYGTFGTYGSFGRITVYSGNYGKKDACAKLAVASRKYNNWKNKDGYWQKPVGPVKNRSAKMAQFKKEMEIYQQQCDALTVEGDLADILADDTGMDYDTGDTGDTGGSEETGGPNWVIPVVAVGGLAVVGVAAYFLLK